MALPHEAFRLGRALVQALPVPKRWSIVRCRIKAVKVRYA
jgi:hypothetical protein